MLYPALGAAMSVVSRLMMGEMDLSEEKVEALRRKQKRLNELSELVADFETTNPISWFRTAVKFTGYSLKRYGNYESVWEFFEDHPHRQIPCKLSFVFDTLLDAPSKEIVYMGDYVILYAIRLDTGHTVMVSWYPRSNYDDRSLYVPANLDDLGPVWKGIADIFWRDRRAVLIDVEADNSYNTRDFDVSDRQYWGPLESMIDWLREYREHGFRRNLLLHGKPGVGKTEFSYQAAHELSDRTLILSGDFCERAGTSNWHAILDALRPEMVVAEDIDRLGREELGQRLRLFEEGWCDIPYVILTSNDLKKFPRAFLRPGRVSRTQEVTDPGDEICWRIIRNIGEKLGCEVPENRRAELIELMRELSVDHVQERIRRSIVEGWDVEVPEGDLTFNPPEDTQDEDSDDEGGSKKTASVKVVE